MGHWGIRKQVWNDENDYGTGLGHCSSKWWMFQKLGWQAQDRGKAVFIILKGTKSF